ncbi:MAG: hypothetical protein RLZZ458_2866 [Planctomycetota bacterium]
MSQRSVRRRRCGIRAGRHRGVARGYWQKTEKTGQSGVGICEGCVAGEELKKDQTGMTFQEFRRGLRLLSIELRSVRHG